MKTDILKIWLPVKKTEAGTYKVIISDTSLDRQDEVMSKSVIRQIVEKSQLIALANHDNSMQSWVGGFNKMEEMEKNGHYAAVAEPWFFSKAANPLAAQIERQVEESLERGLNPGISIGARALEHDTTKINGKEHLRHTSVEPLEATWTPIGANRNSYAFVEKSFNPNQNKNEVHKMPEEEKTEITEETTEEKTKEESSSENDESSESSEEKSTNPDVSKEKQDFKEEKEVKDEKKKDKKPVKSLTMKQVEEIFDKKLSNRESFLKAIRENSSDSIDTEKIQKDTSYIEDMLGKHFGGTI